MTYIARAVAALKQHNYKLTLKRQLALQYIESSQGVFSPYHFVADYPEAKFDKVTLYRFFDILVSLHLVQKIHSLNGYVRMDCCHHEHQHYFLVCSDCHSCEQKVLDMDHATSHSLGIFPNNQSFEIVGRCQPCTTKDRL